MTNYKLSVFLFLLVLGFISISHGVVYGEASPSLAVVAEDLRNLKDSSLSSTVSNVNRVAEELRKYNPTFSVTLSRGSKGNNVLEIQDFLYKSNYLPVAPTGFFGPKTVEAVKQLQDQVGIEPTGIVGPQTREFLKMEPYVLDSNKEDTMKDTNVTLRDCENGDKFSNLTGKACEEKIIDVVETTSATDTTKENTATERDTTPRIMMWYGKVNQHTDAKGDWQTDPDGRSGAGKFAIFGNEGYGDRQLQYCKKWYPNTTSFAPYKLETITTWKERGNVNNWTSVKMSYICLSNPA